MTSSYSGLYDQLFMPTEDTLSSLHKLEQLEQLRKKSQLNILSHNVPSRSNRMNRTYDSASLPRRKEPTINRRQNLLSSYQRTNSYDQSSHLRNSTLTKPTYESLSDRIGSFLRRGSDTTNVTSNVSQNLDSSCIVDDDYSILPKSKDSDYDRRRSHSLTDVILSDEQQVSLCDIYAEGEQGRRGYLPRNAMSLTPASSACSLTEEMPDYCDGMFDNQFGQEYMKTCADIQNLSNISDLPPLEGDDEFQTYISNVAPETDFELYEHQQIHGKANMVVPVHDLSFGDNNLHTVEPNALNTGQIPQPLSAPYYPSNIRQLTTSTNDLDTVEEEIEGTFSPNDRAHKVGNSLASQDKIENYALTIRENICHLVTDLDAPESECELEADFNVQESDQKNHQKNNEMQSRYVELAYSDANDVVEDIDLSVTKKPLLNEAIDEHISIAVDINVDNESLDSLQDDDYKLAPEEKKEHNNNDRNSEFKVTTDNVASESDTENYETASDTEDDLKDGQQAINNIDTNLKDREMHQSIPDTHCEKINEGHQFSSDWESKKTKEHAKYSESEYDDNPQRSPVYEVMDSKYRMQFSHRRPMNSSYSVDSSPQLNNSYSPRDPYTSGSSYHSNNFNSIRSPYQSERPFLGGVSTPTATSYYPRDVQSNYSQTPNFVNSVGTCGTCSSSKVDCSTQTDPELGSKSEISIQTEVHCLTSKGTQTPDKESTTFKDTLIERDLSNSNRILQGQLTEIRSTIKTVLETTPEEPQYLSVKEKKQLFADKAESVEEPPLKGRKELFPKNEMNKAKKTNMTKTILFDLKKAVHKTKPEKPSKLDKVKSALFSGKGKTEEVSTVDSFKVAEGNKTKEHEQPLSPDLAKSSTGVVITQICQKWKQTEQKETCTVPLSPKMEVYKDTTITNTEGEVFQPQSNISTDGNAKGDMSAVNESDEKVMEMDDKTPPKPLTKPKSLTLDKVYWFDVNKEHGGDDKVDGNDTKSPESKNKTMKMSCSSLHTDNSPKKLQKMPKLILQSSDSNLIPNKSDQNKTPVSDQQFTSIRENPFIRNDKTKAELKQVRNRNFHLPSVWQKFSGKNIVSATVKEDDEILKKTNPFMEMLNSSNLVNKYSTKTQTLPSEIKETNDENSKQRGFSPEKSSKIKNKSFSRKGSFGKKNKKRQVSQVHKQTWNYQEKKLVPESEQIAASDVDSVLSRTPSVSGSLISETASTCDASIESSFGIVSASSPDISHPPVISNDFSSSTNLIETDIDEAIRKAKSPECIKSVSSLEETKQGVDFFENIEDLEFADAICDTLESGTKSNTSRDCLAESKKTPPQTKKGKSKKTVDEVSDTKIKKAPVQLDDGQSEVLKRKEEKDVLEDASINFSDWDPCKLLEELYKVQMMPDDTEDISHQFVAMEGLMEKLPMNKKKATLLKTWKRRYFRATDGWLYYYESSNSDRPNESIQLMGGRLDELGNRILGIDDGRGRCLMVRVPTEKEYWQWKLALESQTADNVKATYIRPVFQAKPHPNKHVVIIDIGSSGIRAGILGDKPSLPQLFFPSVAAINKTSKQQVLGIDCFKPEIRHAFTISHPVKATNKVDKFNIDMDVMPIVFQKIFADLKIKPDQYLVMLSMPQDLGDRLKEGLMKVFVDKYHVLGVCMVQQSLLALYSYNAVSGIIVDIGERMEILPIYDGMLIEGGVSRQAYGGQKVRDSLNISLMENKYKFNSPVEQIIVRYIMEKSCYVAEDYKETLAKLEKSPKSIEMTIPLDKYNLPQNSHTSVNLDISRFKSPEGFFNTDQWGMDYPNIHKLVYRAVQACPIDSRKHMYRSIFLSGGVTMLPGFAERLQIHLQQMSPPSVIVEVHASPQRYHSAYIGACSLAGMDIFEQTCIMADEWKANGVQTLKKWNTSPS